MTLSDPVQLALILAIPTFLGPVIALWLSNRAKNNEAALSAKLKAEEKAIDWARQDAVADKQAILAAQQIATAEAAARRVELVAKQAKEAAVLLAARQDAATVQANEQSTLLRATSAKIDVVHGLVNSQYTAALQSEMDATVALLAVLEEILGMKAAQGQPVEQSAREAVAGTKRKIADLRVTLTERQAQAKVANKATAQIDGDPSLKLPAPVTDKLATARLGSIDETLKKQTETIVDEVLDKVKDHFESKK